MKTAPPNESPTKIVVLASGQGSNLKALVEAQQREHFEIQAVGTDRPGCAAQEFANSVANLTTFSVSLKSCASRALWNEALADEVARHAPDLLVLAGFMKVIGDPLITEYAGRIINVHPSLLPAFPGIDAPAQAIAAGVRISGCTVHHVDSGIDTGTILAQAVVPVLPDDNVERLHGRIRNQEHRLLPFVIGCLARGELHRAWEQTTGSAVLTVPSALGPC